MDAKGFSQEVDAAIEMLTDVIYNGDGLSLETMRHLRQVLESVPRLKEGGMCIDEFQKKGWLQEVNREWFHPRGLALSVTVNGEKGDGLSYGERVAYGLAGISDIRDDPEGMFFADLSTLEDHERSVAPREAAALIEDERVRVLTERAAELGMRPHDGTAVQPLGMSLMGDEEE